MIYQEAKTYTDSQAGSGTTSDSYLPLSGGTLTRPLVLPASSSKIEFKTPNSTLSFKGSTGLTWYEETAGSNNNYYPSVFTEDDGFIYINKNNSTFGLIGFVANSDGSKKGIMFSNVQLCNVADPTSAQDVATKNYVDSKLASMDATGVAY